MLSNRPRFSFEEGRTGCPRRGFTRCLLREERRDSAGVYSSARYRKPGRAPARNYPPRQSSRAGVPRRLPVRLRLEPGRGLLQLSEAMSDTAASLEQRALECEQKAEHVTNEASRQTFFELARAWRELAAAYEELGRKGAEPEVGPSEAPGGPP